MTDQLADRYRSWIEQLVGRRARFGFNKVTAVSITGFATGAAEFASKMVDQAINGVRDIEIAC